MSATLDQRLERSRRTDTAMRLTRAGNTVSFAAPEFLDAVGRDRRERRCWVMNTPTERTPMMLGRSSHDQVVAAKQRFAVFPTDNGCAPC
jgi:hypothetical protein